MKTPADFVAQHLYNSAYSAGQCVEGFKIFMRWMGIGNDSPVSSYASNCYARSYAQSSRWVNILSNSGFIYCTDINLIKSGDWYISDQTSTNEAGHVAMYYDDGSGSPKSFGKNQKNPLALFTLSDFSFYTSKFLCFYRPKIWADTTFVGSPIDNVSQTNSDMSDILSNSSSISTSISVDYSKLSPYVVELNRNSPDNVDIEKLKSNKVVSILIEGGRFFDGNHIEEKNFRNPKLVAQMQKVTDAKLPFGLYMIARARSVDEVKLEMYEFGLLLRKYHPNIGAWLKLDLQKSPDKNKEILARYKQELEWLGLKYKIGFMATEDDLESQIKWSDGEYKEDWMLWVNNHVQSLSEINKLLDPMFFDIPYTGVPDTSNALSSATASGSGTGSYSDANASDVQRRIVANARANNGTRAAIYGWCAAWVSGIYQKSGLGYPGGDAYTWWTRWGSSGSSDVSNMPLGVAVIFNKSSANQGYGHIGIHVGNGQVAHNKGGVAIQPVADVAKWTGASAAGWVWPYGKALQRPSITSTASSVTAAVAGVSSDIPKNLSGWKSGVASAYGGYQDASIADNQRTATGDAVTESSMGVAIPMAWNRKDLYKNKHKVYIRYGGKIVQAVINDCGGMGGGTRVLDLQPGVTKAFGIVGAKNWGLRTVEYIIV